MFWWHWFYILETPNLPYILPKMRLIPQLQKGEPSNFQFGYMNFCIEKKLSEPKDPSILHHGQNSYATSLPNPPLGAVGKVTQELHFVSGWSFAKIGLLRRIFIRTLDHIGGFDWYKFKCIIRSYRYIISCVYIYLYIRRYVSHDPAV